MDNSLHIGFLAPTAYRYFQGQGFGGAELQLIQLAKMFLDAGYRVSILTYDQTMKDFEEYDGIRLVKTPLRFLGGSNWHFLPDSLRFIKIVKSLKLDYCFLKNPNSILFQLALAGVLTAGLKTFKIFASNADTSPGRTIADYLYRTGLKIANGVIFQTEAQQKAASTNLGISGPVISNIFFPKNAAELPADIQFDVLWVGGFYPFKSPERIYEIATRLPHIRFAVISKPLTLEKYRPLLNKLQQLPNILFVGHVPFEQTQSYFKRAKIFLCTSEVEGFPNTFLQSWYEKCPVVSVTFPCDGILERENSGFLSGSIEQTVRDIDVLIKDEKLRSTFGKNGYNYLCKNHMPDKILSAYQKLVLSQQVNKK